MLPTYTAPMALCPGCLCTIPPETVIYVAYQVGHRAPLQASDACEACGKQDLLRTVSVPQPLSKETSHA
jgi:hypothetical protein